MKQNHRPTHAITHNQAHPSAQAADPVDDTIDADLEDSSDSSDLEDVEDPVLSDADWDVFLTDDNDIDPLPEYGDFWDEIPDDD